MGSNEPFLLFIRHGFLNLLHVVLWGQVELVAGGNFAFTATRGKTFSFALRDLAGEHDFHLNVVDILWLMLNQLIDVVKSFDSFLKLFWRLIDQLLVR